MKTDLVVTLAENDFFLGTSVLYNSLVKHGFDGRFVVGTKAISKYRTHFENLALQSGDKPLPAEIDVVEVQTTWHMTNFKAQFLDDMFDRYPDAELAIYFDPDIVADAPWEFFRQWCGHGIALAGDVNWRMPPDHPIRREWVQLLEKNGTHAQTFPSLYYNGGFVGLLRQYREFAKTWSELIQQLGSLSNPLDGKGDIGDWRRGGRWQTVMSPNQDTLNMAAMVTSYPLATVGPCAMGFTPGDNFIPHAIGGAKPWRKKYVRDAIRGRPPRLIDKLFWQHAAGPLAPYNSSKIRIQGFLLRIASAIGRFYRRR